tara:strand:- start:284 stop:508 length:225 start_codon:yes stop_codon:yes gene_type:complete
LHDAVTSERLGIPAVAILTHRFVSAGDLMASALGAQGYRFAQIEHPISSASTVELEVRANAVLQAVAQILLRTD